MTDIRDKLRINPDMMQYHFDENNLTDLSFDKVAPCNEIIGQDRAAHAAADNQYLHRFLRILFV